jgi:hypothetical protein
MVQVNFFGQQKRRCELRWFKCIFLDNKSGAASCALIFWTTDRRFDFFYPKAQIHKWLSKKCRSLSKRCESNNRSALYYSSNRRPTWKAAMKRCALCHGRLGLGARFRNIWNGRWWVHVRFCSVRCEGIYEVRRNEAAKHRWHTFLARGNSPSKLIGPTA